MFWYTFYLTFYFFRKFRQKIVGSIHNLQIDACNLFFSYWKANNLIIIKIHIKIDAPKINVKCNFISLGNVKIKNTLKSKHLNRRVWKISKQNPKTDFEGGNPKNRGNNQPSKTMKIFRKPHLMLRLVKHRRSQNWENLIKNILIPFQETITNYYQRNMHK